MRALRGIVPTALVLSLLAGGRGLAASGGSGDEGDVLVARLVHPDRQAAEVLRLFEGARWSDPAAALAAWKQATGGARSLGKATEAAIASFNPEMVAEWAPFDGAELHVAADPSCGGLGWFARIPRDDGTLGAGIIAMRLTYPEDRGLIIGGQERPVARLAPSGGPLAVSVGPDVIVASSRPLLERGARTATGRGWPADSAIGRAGAPGEPGSGTIVRIEPGRIALPPRTPTACRRAIEAIRALGCRRIDGIARLEDGKLTLEITTTPEGEGAANAAPRRRMVERSWLEGLPSEGVLAAVSLAMDPAPSSWDRAFDAADRLERADPARAGLAPLRTRLNLLASAVNLKLEADLLPHLLGLSACLFGEPGRPGRVAGALVVLHLDDPEVARRLAGASAPRLRTLLGGGPPDRVDSRAAELRSSGRDVRITWGPVVRPGPGRSLAALCGGWGGEGRGAPARVGAVWPGRLGRLAALADLGPASVGVLADDPPVVWWGWSEEGREHDLIRWSGLRGRVRAFLETIPGATGPSRPLPELPDGRFKD